MKPDLSVNVISKDYGFGLGRSRALVVSVLEEGGLPVAMVKARFFHGEGRHRKLSPGTLALQRFLMRFDPRCWWPRHYNIFMEKIYPSLVPFARRQLFIPNQEWFFEDQLSYLKQIELVICKTRHAEEIFGRLGCRTAFSSFTSNDCRRPEMGPMRREFLCLGAKRPSVRNRLIALWLRHPEWPRLTISSEVEMPEITAANVRAIGRFMTDEEIVRLQNEHQFHLCTTRAEGFGHKLNEGMSCGAIVIATDGAPMNELITPERGMLVKVASSEPLGLGTAYDFGEADLELAIEKCVTLSTPEIEGLSARARSWFEGNDRFFRQRLAEILRELG